MNERKKNLPKRLLSMTLALSMCAGLSCTTAFATAPDPNGSSDTVYVYVNVVPDTVKEDKAEAAPTFNAEGTDKALETAKETVENAKPSTEKPVFDKDTAEKEAGLNTAKGEVTSTLEELNNADKPVYSETQTPSTPEPSEGDNNLNEPTLENQENLPAIGGEATGSDGDGNGDTNADADEVSESFDAGKVNEQVGALNGEQEATDSQVNEAKTNADNTLNKVNETKNALDKALESLKGTFEADKTAAKGAIEAAQKAIDACNAKQKELDESLQTQIDALKNPETAPVRDNYQSYDEYSAAYDTWKEDCEKYNEDVQAIKDAYDVARGELDVESKAAQEAVDKATRALETAEKAMKAFNDKSAEGFANLNQDLPALKAYNEALQAYQSAVEGYNTAAGNYNDAVDKYDDAVKKFDQAVTDHNNLAVDYNTEVGNYNDEVTKYETALNNYNDKVDTFNKTASEWNTEKATAAEGKISEKLSDISEDEIAVYKDVNEKLAKGEAATLTASDVAKYNNVVNAYNKAIDSYNQGLVKAKIEEVSKYFKGQVKHENLGSTNQWFTVGTINISGVFSKKPGEIRDQFLDKTKYDYTYNDENTAEKDRANVKGRDIYYFDRKDGVIGSPDQANWEENVDGTIYNPNKGVDDLKDALSTGKFTKYGDRNTAADFDLKTDIDRWVLKVSYTSHDYGKETEGQETLHLDGYLYVTQLSKLALLEVRAESEYSKITDRADDQVPGVPEGEKNLSDANPYEGYKDAGVEIPGNTQETLDLKDLDVPEFSAPDLTTGVPALIENIPGKTPAPEPTTPPSGGGDNPGGGSNPGGGGNDNPPVDIPEEDPPLVDVPEEDPPLVDIPEEEPPLVDAPEEDPVLDIPEEEPPLVAPPTTVVITETKTPLVKAPAGVDIVDEAVPLADVPKTGDNTALWIAMALASAGALAVLAPRKKENG